VAGAFQKSVEAAAFAKAADDIGREVPILLTQGTAAFVTQIKASSSITAALTALVAHLEKFAPATVSDAGALIAAYGDAIDALSFSRLGGQLLDAPSRSGEQAASQATEGAVYNDLAGTLVDAASDVLAVGRDPGGAPLGPKLDLNGVAELFRSAAAANLRAFETSVIEPAANAAHISAAAAQARIATNDSDYSLAVTGHDVIGALPTFFGAAATNGYAEIAGALSLYNRTAGLVAKYSSLGRLDPRALTITGISNNPAFTAASSFAQDQLARTVGLLQSKRVNPTIAVADNEIAGIDRDGDVSAKLRSLTEYWDGYLSGRLLAYLGGFAGS
jgi:hypothetical protein